jgi:predicted transcriptional regulator of viral defense system
MPELFTQAKWLALLRNGKSLYSFAELQRLTRLSEAALRRGLVRLGQIKLVASLGKELYANLLKPPTLEEAASALYPPAYISLESALFMHGVLDQAPHVLTCATLNKTKRFRTKLGEIFYAHLKPDLFFGYHNQQHVALAEPEKAALDFVYLQKQNGIEPALDEWNWEHLELKRLRKMSVKYPKSVRRSLEKFQPEV